MIGTSITEKLVSRVNETGGYFSVSADETVDNKNQEQLVITIRYTLSGGHVVEEFLCFIDVSDGTTGEQLSATILEVLAQTGFDLTKMREQCYDGAENIQIERKWPKALPFWCCSHQLNRVIVNACSLQIVQNSIGTADKIVKFF